MNAVIKQQLLLAAQALQSALEEDDEQVIHLQSEQLAQLLPKKDNVDTTVLSAEKTAELHKLLTVTLPDIHDRLDYIKQVTHQAAHQTLSIVDDATMLISTLQHHADKLSPQDSSKMPDIFHKVDQLQSAFNDITTNQHFQDLTGQVIHQITDLIGEVATDLSQLLTMTDINQPLIQQKNESDPIRAEGPQINTNKANIVNAQDDVDDLLSSLEL